MPVGSRGNAQYKGQHGAKELLRQSLEIEADSMSTSRTIYVAAVLAMAFTSVSATAAVTQIREVYLDNDSATVLIVGRNFIQEREPVVRFGNLKASVIEYDDRFIRAEVPPGLEGSFRILVNSGSKKIHKDKFTSIHKTLHKHISSSERGRRLALTFLIHCSFLLSLHL